MDWIDKTWINKTLIDVKPCFINQCFIDPLQIYAFFYITCVRSVIDYAAPVFHHALPAYLSQELERVQKRAMRIICPGIEYQQGLALMSLPTVAESPQHLQAHVWKHNERPEPQVKKVVATFLLEQL